MRLQRWISLIVLALLMTGCGRRIHIQSKASGGGRGADHGVPQQVKAPANQPAPRMHDHEQSARRIEASHEPAISWEIEGFGQTRRDAEEEALRKAREEVSVFVAEQDPPLQWRPSVNYVRQLEKGSEDLEPKDVEGVGTLEHVKVRIEVTPADYQQMEVQDRRQRAENRMGTLWYWLAGLVIVQVVLWGYLRAEEATKGYYTTWLRVAALGFVGLLGAGLWYLSVAKSPNLSFPIEPEPAVLKAN